MVFRGMTVALVAILAFGVSAEAATNRDARAKPGRATAGAAPVSRSSGPAVRPVAERSAPGRRGEARAEPRGRGPVEARGRGAVELRGRFAETRGRVAAEPRGRMVAEPRGRLESRGRTVARVEDRWGRSSARGGRFVEAPVASYRTVGLFSRPAAASALRTEGRDEGDERRGGGKMSRGGRGAWHAGLPAADGEQTACPAGTISVLAQGHSSTYRCMPI